MRICIAFTPKTGKRNRFRDGKTSESVFFCFPERRKSLKKGETGRQVFFTEKEYQKQDCEKTDGGQFFAYKFQKIKYDILRSQKQRKRKICFDRTREAIL